MTSWGWTFGFWKSFTVFIHIMIRNNGRYSKKQAKEQMCLHSWKSFTDFIHIMIRNNGKYSKKQAKERMCLHSWNYMINHIEDEDENEKKSHKYDINRPRSKHGHKYSKYEKCLNMMMLSCIKQHLSNTWS